MDRRALSRSAAVLTAAIGFIIVVAAPDVSWAHRNHLGRGDFGLGLMVGAPTGLSAEYRLTQKTAVDFAAGLNVIDGNGFYLHLNYIVMPFSITHSRSVIVPFYLGVGGVMASQGDRYPDGGDLQLGARVPFGIAFEFAVPVQVFIEAAAYLMLLDTRTNHSSGWFGWDAALGFRVFF